jgi:hypothetical protein
MLYSFGSWVICDISQFEDENKRFLILIDAHYGESFILLLLTLKAFLIDSEWISVRSVLLNSFSCYSFVNMLYSVGNWDILMVINLRMKIWDS